jgi:hypothetical protein
MKRRSIKMNSIFRKTTLVLLVIFALLITGCLSNSVNQPNAKTAKTEVTNDKKEPVVKPNTNVKPTTDVETDTTTNSNLVIYNPLANKAPMVTQFIIEELDEPVVEKGQTIELKASGIDPEGGNVTIIYEATAGTIIGNKWTAPNVAGIYQVKAIATDGVLSSKPDIINLTVPGKAGGLSGFGVGISKNAPEKIGNSPSRAISSVSGTTDTTLNLNGTLEDKYLLATSQVVYIELSYTTTSTNIGVAAFADTGNIEVYDWDDNSTGGYDHVYKYTAPSTVPTTGKVTVVFDIVNPADIDDYAQTTVTFKVNAIPTISSVVFSGTAASSIAPSATKTITVTASDTTGDTLTYNYQTFTDGTALYAGTLSEASNSTGTVDYSASAYAGTEKVLVIVMDQNGGVSQRMFSFSVAAPMYAVIADDNVADADGDGNTYEDATDGAGSVLSTADVTTYDDGVTTGEFSYPYQTNDNADIATGTIYDTGFEMFTDNVPSGTATYAWTDAVGSKSLVSDTSGADTGSFVSSTVAIPEFLAMYPGMHTLTAVATDSADTNLSVQATESVYVNEAPYISSISYTDSDGNTQSLWNGTSQPSTVPQVSPGQVLTVNVSVTDADNTRVNPTNDADGFFSDTSTKFLAKLIDTDDVSFVDESTEAQIESGDGYTNQGTAASTIANPIAFEYEIKPQANTSITRYLVVKVADGYDNVADGSAALALTADFDDNAFLVNAAGIAKAADASNTGIDTRVETALIMIDYAQDQTNKTGSYYLEAVDTTSPVDGVADEIRVYDETAGAYITDADGDIITLGTGGATPGTLEDDDGLTDEDAATPDTSYGWLQIDISGAAALANWAVGDKVYFKTYTTQVVVPLEIVAGPKITAIAYNKYVTLGEQVDIIIYGNNDGDAASATIIQNSSDGGTFAAGTEGDSDSVTGEYWTYTAPSTLTTSTVRATVVITDGTDATQKISRDVTFYLNRKPIIGSVQATDNVNTTDGNWAKKGTHNISLSASVSDSDTGDVFGYLWSVPNTNNGSLNFAGSSSAIWDPYNGATALTAVGGPTSNGQYPIQLTVFDKDSTGIAKSGATTKTIVIGINENPDVGVHVTTGAALDGLGITEAVVGDGTVSTYDATEGTEWVSAGTDVVDDAATGNGLGTTTITFAPAAGQPRGVKVKVTPVGVSDEADDRDSLNYAFYLTQGTKEGAPVTTENFEYTAVTDANSSVAIKGLRWEPSVAMRKGGGNFWLHYRVTDDKYGVAKGVTDWTEKLTITKDTAIAAPAPALVDATVYGTDQVDGTAWSATTKLKAGSKIVFSVPANGVKLPWDTEEAYVNIGPLYTGITNAVGLADDLLMPLTRNTQGTATPIDDTFDGEWVAPTSITVDTSAGAAAAVPFRGLSEFRAIDMVGNMSLDTTVATALGTTNATFTAAAATNNADYDPPIHGALTNTTVTNSANTDGVAAGENALNGDTNLQVAAANPESAVARIGSEVVMALAVTDTLLDTAAVTAVASATIMDFSNFNPKNADGTTTAYAPTDGLTALVTVNGLANQLVLDTAVANTSQIVSQGDGTDLVLGENSSISTWGSAPIYNVTVKTTDNALAATVAATWPADSALGNMDIDDIDFINWANVEGNSGMDLKRPTVTGVEVYSFDVAATYGQAGWAPIGVRQLVASGVRDMIAPTPTDWSAYSEGDSVTVYGNATDFSDIVGGMIVAFEAGGNEIRAYAAADGSATATSMSFILMEDGMNLGALPDLVMGGITGFSVLDVTLFGQTNNTAGVTAARVALDDNDDTTAEILKITFDEPLFINQDIDLYTALYGLDTADAYISSTVNDYSLQVYEYRANGVDKDIISLGAADYYNDTDIVATANVAAADEMPLYVLKNYAYQQTGYGTTGISTVYIVLGSKQLTGTVVYDGTSALTGTSSSFTTELAVGDYIEIQDAGVNTNTFTVRVVSITSDTVAVVAEDGVAVAAIAGGSQYAKAFRNVGAGKHFEVIFADYETDAVVNGGADDRYRILCDQHGNAINASQNNYIKGNGGISW